MLLPRSLKSPFKMIENDFCEIIFITPRSLYEFGLKFHWLQLIFEEVRDMSHKLCQQKYTQTKLVANF